MYVMTTLLYDSTFFTEVYMAVIRFEEMMQKSFNVTKIEAVERRWRGGNVNSYHGGRGENVISCTLEGKKRILDKDGNLLYEYSAPAVLLISKGTPYASCTCADGGDGHTICVRFALSDDLGEELTLSAPFRLWAEHDSERFLPFFRELLAVYLSAEANPVLLKAKLYELLTALLKMPKGSHSSEEKQIMPAINYIKSHLDENVSITKLASLCFLSESYFRSRFHETTGLSPTDYRNHLRVEKASELLKSSLWTVDLIAETLGFCDTSHFYRVYKKISGKTPRSDRE